MGDRTEETKALLRHALLRREASAENDQLQDLFESLCKDIAALTADRDRLAADLAAANATLDRLREAVPIDITGWTMDDVVDAFFKTQHRLYPPETTNDDR